jgi:hypothetical protein
MIKRTLQASLNKDLPSPHQEPRFDEPSRIDFVAGQIAVPDDFDKMHEDEIDQLFNGKE